MLATFHEWQLKRILQNAASCSLLTPMGNAGYCRVHEDLVRNIADDSAGNYPHALQIQQDSEHHRSRDLDYRSEIDSRLHDAVVTDLPMPAFSSINFGLNVASWSVILRPSARSTLAPKASLLRLSVFSGVGWYRCCCRRFCSRRSNPCVHSLISCIRGSLFDDEDALVCEVLSEAARDGTPLKVEKRLDVRLDATCQQSLSADMHCGWSRLGARKRRRRKSPNPQFRR